MSGAREALERAFAQATAHHRAGQLGEAEQLYRDILAAHPQHTEALRHLALIASGAGYLEEAEGLLRRAVAAAPRNADIHNSLGAICKSLGNLAEAEKHYREAIKRRPGYAEAMSNLAALLNQQFRLTEALEWARRAVAIKPDFAGLNNFANTLGKLGLAEDAVEAYRRCVGLVPRYELAWSSLLLGMHYVPSVTPQALFEAHVRTGNSIAEGLVEFTAFGERRASGRLRVGYISSDFRTGSVSHFILPILQNHDPSAVEVTCYSDGIFDAVAERTKSLVGAWRQIRGVPNELVAQAIRDDRIDVLVDLSGHTSDRLPVFALRAAPVQVTYLGYPDTTGLAAMDYRLTDSFADPAGEADAHATETLVRLDPCAWCYAPIGPTPEVRPRREGPLTFGSFNSLPKLSAPALEAFAGVLRETPGSRLMLKSQSLHEASVRERLTRTMAAHGIEPARLDLRGFEADAGRHLAMYDEVDIGLDPFPYQGTTTTCDSLWMGVPVVTLAGRSHVSRVGVSLLNAVGLGELVAADVQDYVRRASHLATERERLAALRGELRERMRRSPLMDAPGFCRRLEAAYRTMWHSWCSQARL